MENFEEEKKEGLKLLHTHLNLLHIFLFYMKNKNFKIYKLLSNFHCILFSVILPC